MEQFLRSFEFAFGRALGRAAGGLLAIAALALLVIVAGLILYGFLRHRFGISINFHSAPPPHEAPDSPVAFRQETGGSKKHYTLAQSLDQTGRTLARIYLALTYLLMAGATILMALLYFKHPDDSSRQFMLFYGGAVYVVAMIGLSNQLSKARERLNPRSDSADLLETLRSKIQVKVETAPTVGYLDDASLNRASQLLDSGASLDDVCGTINAEYLRMDPLTRRAYQAVVEAALKHRRAR